jgi:uncharacterized protein (DUF433 family)
MEGITKTLLVQLIVAWLQHGIAIENALENNGLSQEEINEIVEEVCKEFDK